MTMPVEFIIQCLPDQLRSFIIKAAIENYHYQTGKIFVDSEDNRLITRLLYAVDWDILRSYMSRYHNIKGHGGTRKFVIDTYMKEKNPTLLEVVISINEMYENHEMVKSLRELERVHKIILDRLSKDEKQSQTQNKKNDKLEHSYLNNSNDDNDDWVPRSQEEYYGYSKSFETDTEKAERLYGIPDHRLVED